MSRTCRVCGNQFNKDEVRPSHYESYFCSSTCSAKQRKELREKHIKERKCRDCGDDLPPPYLWDDKRCPECLEKNRNYSFKGFWNTDAEIRNGIHKDVENKLDV